MNFLDILDKHIEAIQEQIANEKDQKIKTILQHRLDGLVNARGLYEDHCSNEWISVTDRLPTDEDCKHGRYMECLLYFADTNEVWAGEFNEYLLKENNNADINVTHWQPLPAPPKN